MSDNKDPDAVTETKITEPQQAVLSSGENNSKKAKKTAVILSLLSLFIVFLGVIVFGVLGGDKSDVAFTVDGQEVSIQTLELYEEQFRASAEIAGDENPSDTAKERAREELALNIMLKNDAQRLGIEFDSASIDDIIESKFSYDTSEEYLDFMENQYGWSSEVVYTVRENEELKRLLGDQILKEYTMSSMLVRWDNLGYPSTRPDKDEFERRAIERLNSDFMPLLRRSATAEELSRAADMNPDTPLEEGDRMLQDIEGLYTQYTFYDGFTESFEFAEYPEGESNWDMIRKLDGPGSYTPIFKSSTGYYVIFRIESVSEGEYDSWESYFTRESADRIVDGVEVFVLAQSTSFDDRLKWVSQKIKESFASQKVSAQTADCYSSHPVRYNVTFRDMNTNSVIDGANLDIIRAAGDGCTKRTSSPYYVSGGRQGWRATVNGTRQALLNCQGGHWLWRVSSPSGYQAINYNDDSHFPTATNDPNRAQTNAYAPQGWGAGGPLNANGATVNMTILLRPDTPPEPDPEPFSVRSTMIAGGVSGGGGPTLSGSFSANHYISQTGSSTVSSNTNGSLSFGGTTDNSNNVAVSAPWTVTDSNGREWQRRGSSRCYDSSGSCRSAGVETTTRPRTFSVDGIVNNGGTVRVYWFYEELIDVCPNLPGRQDSVPSGRILDSSGNCVPIGSCPSLPNPLITRTLPRLYSQSAPSGYSSWGSTRTRRVTTETRYISHADISSGGSRILPQLVSQTAGNPGRATLNYAPYTDSYPYDSNQARVTYRDTHTRYTYRATGSPVYEDIYEWRRVEEERTRTVRRFVDGSWTWVTETYTVWVWRYVDTGRDRLVGYRWVLSSTSTGNTRTATRAWPRMDPCWDRTFDGNPSITGASLTPDRESPNTASATARVAVDFSVPYTNRGRSDVRQSSRVNNYDFATRYRIRRANGSYGPYTTSTYRRTITAPNNQKITQGSTSQAITMSVNVPGNLRVGDTVCFSVTAGSPERGVMNVGGSILSGTGTQASGESCAPPVVNWPYFKIFGNDVVSGGSFGSCLVGGGRINAHTRGQAGVGSSTQYAAFAVGAITGFSSASLKPLSADVPVPPTGLTFANLSAGGGQYSANDGSTCLPDYFANEQFSNATPLSGSNAARSSAVVSQLGSANADPRTLEWFNAGSSLTLSNSGDIPVAQGSRKVIYIDGRLNINSDIVFESNWTSRDDIPFVMIVAREINIAPGVEQIDGVYVAQPGPGLNGTIRTCSTTGSATFNSCQNPLVVNGSLLAANVQFNRTRGSLRDASLNEGRSGINPVNIGGNCSWTQSPTSDGTVGGDTCAAEIINFAPEVYMALTQLLTPEENFRYDSYTTLPPNL